MRFIIAVVTALVLALMAAPANGHVALLKGSHAASERTSCTTIYSVKEYTKFAKRLYNRPLKAKKPAGVDHKNEVMHKCQHSFAARKRVGKIHDRLKANRESRKKAATCSNSNPVQCAFNAARALKVSASWLLACARSEGGLGPQSYNRMNTAGSGAGGNWQFMSGTFYGYVRSALRAAGVTKYIKKRYGTKKNPSGLIWLNSEQQAYTAAYMFSIGQSRQWTGPGC